MQAPSTPPAVTPPVRRRRLIPHIYNPSASRWSPLPKNSPRAALLERGTLIRLISWNIDFSIPSHSERTSTALDYLATLFSRIEPPSASSEAPKPDPAPMIIMLQEMTSESVDAILSHPWVRQNFIISEKNPSEQMYFTFLLVDRQLVTADWFRSAYSGSRYGRDALGVDILAAFDGDENAENQRPARRLRFLTTHLESLAETPGFEQRPKQLAVCSRLLKEETVGKYGFEICGGVVGGDMNAISEVDKVTHWREEVGLTDIWEEGIASEGVSGGDGTEIKMGWVEDTFGREEGHTWGYQPRQRWPPIRFDKFFYTGSLETVALEEVRDSSGKVGRLGVGLKTQKGMWVSDHFGIAVGVKML